MNKFGKYFFVCFLICCVCIMSGCKSRGGKDDITRVVNNFNENLNIENSNVSKNTFQWLNYDDPDFIEYNVSGYNIHESGIKKENLPNLSKIFDGRYSTVIGDGIDGYLAEYSKDDVVCYYSEMFDQEIPYEIFEGERDDTVWDNFMENVTYEIDLSCGKMPESAITKRSIYLNAIGKSSDWNMSIRGGNVSWIDKDGLSDYYINSFSQTESGTRYFNGYNIVGNIYQRECIDNNRVSHSYEIILTLKGDLDYAGCADVVNFNFLVGEQGTLSNFIKKTNYTYKGNTNIDDVSYSIIDMVNNYMYVDLYENNPDGYTYHQIIMEYTNEGRKVLYEGDAELSDEECEELNQYDHNLMDMFFLVSCPRG